MLKRLFALLPCILLVSLLYAQEGMIIGKVSDAKTKEALGGVSIYLDGKGMTTSNSAGAYEMKAAPGSHSAEFKFIGYTPFKQAVEVKAEDTVRLNISLNAEATELGTVVVSAGKYEQKIEEVTVSMEVMKQGIIENKNTTNMEDLMQQCPGVNVLDGQANIRGGSGFSYGAGTRVLVLVDDMPLLTGDAGDVKWNFIPIENIQQIEVIKGASSALFGSSALNGVINFRTAYPTDTAHTSASISSGFYDRPRRGELVWWGNASPTFSNASFFHSQQIKNLDLTIGGNGFSDDGYRQLEREQRYRFNFGTRYRFQKVKGLSAGVNGNYMDTHGGLFLLWKSADSAYYPQGGKVSDYHTVRATVDPYITYFTPGGQKHSLRTRFYEAINTNNTNQESTSKVWYADYQYQLHLKHDLTVTSGLTATYSEVFADSSFSDSINPKTGQRVKLPGLYGTHFSNNLAIYSQADKKFNRLIVSLGVRGEYFKVDTAETKTKIAIGKKDTAVLPIHPVFRTGLNYHLFSHTWLRASFGQGYRFPSVAEKFISTQVSGLKIFPNPQIQPETGWSAEVAAKQEFKLGLLRGYADLAGFWQEYNNMMEFTFNYWVPADSLKHPTAGSLSYLLNNFGAKSINIGRTQIKGAEITFALQGKIRNLELTAFGGYTYIHPIDLDYDSAKSGGTYNGNILKYRYEHTAKCDVQADYRKWSVGVSFRYNSFMKNIDASFQKELFQEAFTPIFPSYHTNLYILPGLKEYREQHNTGDAVFDFRVARWLSKIVKASVVVNNVFNREYMGRPGDVQPPRTYAVRLEVKM